MSTIDLDHNATTPLCPEARTAILAALEAGFGNPSSTHGRGQAARALIDQAREQVASALGVRSSGIVFTSGATEANLLAWHGVIGPKRRAGAPVHAVTTTIEHASIQAVADRLRADGVAVTSLPVAFHREGGPAIDPAAAAAAIDRPGTALLSVMAVNNEFGTCLPIEALGRLARRRGVLVHSDATQAIGKIPLNFMEMQIDLASLSAHKFGGPAGVGALWIGPGVVIEAVQPGHQERGVRAGTENLLGIVGLGAAASALSGRLKERERIRALRDRLWRGIGATVPDVARNAEVPADAETGQTLNISFLGVLGSALLMALDLEDVAVSSGAACSSGSLQPSPVLLAVGDGSAAWLARARGSIRFSLGPETTEADVERLLALLPEVVRRVRGSAAGAVAPDA